MLLRYPSAFTIYISIVYNNIHPKNRAEVARTNNSVGGPSKEAWDCGI